MSGTTGVGDTARRLVPILATTFRRTPWKNGGGVTIDIADAYRPGAEPGGWTGMTWRFGRTRIGHPGPFSDLSGFGRVLAVVAGRGLVLHLSDGRELDVREPFRPVRFAGEWPITSGLEAGPVEVLNVIGDRREVAIDLRFLMEAGQLRLSAGDHVFYAPAGDAHLNLDGEPFRIGGGDAVQVRLAGSAVLDHKAGTVALASIAPA